jgi:hypothetical protein
VADHIAIDVSLLRETSRRLGRVAEILGQARGTAQDDARAVAQRELAEAMRDFAENWRVHREQLIDSVSGAAKFVAGAANAYQRLDQDLATGLPDATGTGQP